GDWGLQIYLRCTMCGPQDPFGDVRCKVHLNYLKLLSTMFNNASMHQLDLLCGLKVASTSFLNLSNWSFVKIAFSFSSRSVIAFSKTERSGRSPDALAASRILSCAL